jgi:hypothetical protein
MIFARANFVSVHHLNRRKARILIASTFRLFGRCPQGKLNDSGGLWRVERAHQNKRRKTGQLRDLLVQDSPACQRRVRSVARVHGVDSRATPRGEPRMHHLRFITLHWNCDTASNTCFSRKSKTARQNQSSVTSSVSSSFPLPCVRSCHAPTAANVISAIATRVKSHPSGSHGHRFRAMRRSCQER